MKVVPLILRQNKLSEDELLQGMNLAETSLTWRAIIQIIEMHRDEQLLGLAAMIAQNSTAGISGAGGAIDILNALIAFLQQKRVEGIKKNS